MTISSPTHGAIYNLARARHRHKRWQKFMRRLYLTQLNWRLTYSMLFCKLKKDTTGYFFVVPLYFAPESALKALQVAPRFLLNRGLTNFFLKKGGTITKVTLKESHNGDCDVWYDLDIRVTV